VPPQAVIPLLTMPTIYEVPLVLQEAGLGDLIVDKLDLPAGAGDLADWKEWVERLKNPERTLEVAVVGKYVELPDAYLSVKESLIHAAVAHEVAVNIRWIHSEAVAAEGAEAVLGDVDGILRTLQEMVPTYQPEGTGVAK
jgi:CTP synthase